MSELREVCVGLHPPVIDDGVELVARHLVNKFETTHALNIDLVLQLPPGIIESHSVSMAVFRVLHESLNNVVKHAQTSEASVELSASENELALIVADKGVGSPLAHLSHSELLRHHHVGICGMLEWAGTVNGNLSIQPNEPQGTRVVFRVPLKEPHPRKEYEPRFP